MVPLYEVYESQTHIGLVKDLMKMLQLYDNRVKLEQTIKCSALPAAQLSMTRKSKKFLEITYTISDNSNTAPAVNHAEQD